MALGAEKAEGLVPARAVAWVPARAAALGGGVYSVGGGVSEPIPIYKPEPAYSEEARKAKYQGTVVLWIVVDAAGAVTDCRVVKPLGLGLDEKAVETVRTWKFKPAHAKRYAGAGARHGGSQLPIILTHVTWLFVRRSRCSQIRRRVREKRNLDKHRPPVYFYRLPHWEVV